jgi:hypothetical protein
VGLSRSGADTTDKKKPRHLAGVLLSQGSPAYQWN